MCWFWFWLWRDVRELLKELRRLLREKSLRTDWPCFCCAGFCLALAGESGVRKLSVRSMSLLEDVEVDIFASGSFSLSGSGVGGSVALRMSSAEVGWDERGPPPAVGGRASGIYEGEGDLGGVSGGAGMFVPSVREKSTGVRVRKEELRRE